MRTGKSSEAFSLVEILVAIAIIGVLVVTVVLVSRGTLTRSEGVRCIEHMRSLHTSLAAYTQDRGHWPQEPKGLWDAAGDNDAFEDWWIEEILPYGATEQNWQCPTIMRKVVNKSKKKRPRIHYTPTMFDAKPMTPYKWSTQPWFIEIGNMHGRGAQACFPDGSIRGMSEMVGSK